MSDGKSADVLHILPRNTGEGLPGVPQPEVIAALESFLELAREGKIQAVAIAAVKANRMASEHWAYGTGPHTHSLGYAISMLQHRFYAVELEYSEEDPDDLGTPR